ncbi:UDP-2,4-diacetamido-2,4,6-trideoxy-beta-L-altropyranose hydrolase [Halopseudomonas bauzanensis]|uniref:UDP-2,4-diacetamido-2,4,6-trideoxy-beta-L-altropyranose hydrolase n=2 Tax=Halopseudomonas bauzanensis TaxID=653930 RepID=A0A1I4J874_9GAMM|nr:UDP-2,4-diacetamido-2,4,6-trideoxy-beta-L-altropyranose hydrolase [Halopseudomonas bauzanensis]
MDVQGPAGAVRAMNNRAVVFRADASLEMGTGHLMRCLTLANALQAQGHDCHFICREHPGHLIEYVRQQGHKVYSLACIANAETDETPAHARWLGATQAQDAALCAAILSVIQPRWLVVDHYALDARWEQQLEPHYRRLLVIDDLADRPHLCDVLLDQTLGRDPLDYQPWVPMDCRVLCGAQYALLRPEFAALRPYSLQRRQSAPLHHILVSMGGVDKDNATGQILTALATVELPADCTITVVMGSTAPWLETIRRQAARMPVATLVRSGVGNMAQLMADSDLAIGAAGATSWERCCLGLPAIMVVLATNQQQVAAGLQDAQAVRVVLASQDIPLTLPTLMKELLQSTGQLHQMSQAAAAVTDGTGVARVIGHLE